MGIKKVLIVTGEASGDMHGAYVIKELKKIVPNLKVFGIGGKRLKEEGVEIIYPIKKISVVGIWEVVRKISYIHQAMKKLRKRIEKEHPDLCLLINYPGFNLKVAKLVKQYKQCKIKVIYYILPQIWAWGRWRLKVLSKWVDCGISILPFEKKFYQKSPLKVSFVGHPLIDVLSFRGDRREKDLQIALLPGSRREEVVRILPIMLKCVEKLRGFKFVIPVAPELDKEWVKSQIKKELLSQIKVVKNNTYQIIRDSIFAFVASGTATLEACILEVPMVIIYRTSLFSYILGKMFVKTQWIGLPNIIAGKEVVPEFIQFNTKHSKIIKKVNQIIENRGKNVLKLREVKKRLGQKGAILRTAQILSQFLKMY